MSNVLKEIAATLNDVYFKVLYQEFDSEEFEKLLAICKENNVVICFAKLGNAQQNTIHLIGAIKQEFSFTSREQSRFLCIDNYGYLQSVSNNPPVIQSYLSLGWIPLSIEWKMFYYAVGGCPHWRYEFETPMPHETFEIQNGYCLGIVFQLQSKRTLSNG